MNISLKTLIEVEKQFEFILNEYSTFIQKLEHTEFIKAIDKRTPALEAFFELKIEIEEILKKQKVEVTQ
jgi:hypothetical protein